MAGEAMRNPQGAAARVDDALLQRMAAALAAAADPDRVILFGSHARGGRLRRDRPRPMKPGLAARKHASTHEKPKKHSASMQPGPIGSETKWTGSPPGIPFYCVFRVSGLTKPITRPMFAQVAAEEASPVIRVYRSRYSSLRALRVEGICVSTETVECDVQQDSPQRRSIPDAPWPRTDAPNEPRGETGGRGNGPRRSET